MLSYVEIQAALAEHVAHLPPANPFDMPSGPTREKVREWIDNFSEANYALSKRVAELLISADDRFFDPYWGANDDDDDGIFQGDGALKLRDDIKDLGRAINDEGGFKAMQASYCIMKNFMAPAERVYSVQHYWNGVGYWVA